jgi:hypothetical protein
MNKRLLKALKLSTVNCQLSTILTALLLSIAACSSDSDTPAPDPVIPAQRTIIAIFNGNNNLSSDLRNDIKEIADGSKGLSAATNIVVFANLYGQKAYIAEMVDGKSTKVREWDKNAITTTHPDTLLSVMQWIMSKYPANEYGIVFGGHGTGSLTKGITDTGEHDTIPTTLRPAYAYGWDYNTTPTQKPRLWMNTGTLAAVISHLPERPRFIFFDCCLMQDYDVACQFKKYTDYIIAPVSETPSAGAPYKDITPLLTISDTEKMCDTLLTVYRDYCPICISAIKTREVDALQEKTNLALQEIKQNTTLPYVYDHVIYYFKEKTKKLQYDLKSFLYEQNQQGNLSDATYNAFVAALERCVFTKRKCKPWKTAAQIDFTDFDVEDYNYGGLSIRKETIEK